MQNQNNEYFAKHLNNVKKAGVLSNSSLLILCAALINIVFMPVSSSAADNYNVVDVKNDDVLNMRSLPNSSADIVSSIPFNARNISAHKCVKSWCLVEYEGNKGWANSRFLELSDINPKETPQDQPDQAVKLEREHEAVIGNNKEFGGLDPEGALVFAYKCYQLIKSVDDNPILSAVVSDQAMYEAKKNVKFIESAILDAHPEISKATSWEKGLMLNSPMIQLLNTNATNADIIGLSTEIESARTDLSGIQKAISGDDGMPEKDF